MSLPSCDSVSMPARAAKAFSIFTLGEPVAILPQDDDGEPWVSLLAMSAPVTPMLNAPVTTAPTAQTTSGAARPPVKIVAAADRPMTATIATAASAAPTTAPMTAPRSPIQPLRDECASWSPTRAAWSRSAIRDPGYDGRSPRLIHDYTRAADDFYPRWSRAIGYLWRTMARYREELFSFDHPGEWEVRTMAGVAQSPAFQSPTVVVVREPRRPQDTVTMHAQRQLFEMRTIMEFGLEESSHVTLGGLHAARIRYSYTTKNGRLEQCHTYVVDPVDETQIVGILTTARVADLPEVQPIFDAALASVHFDVPPPTSRGENPWSAAEIPEVPMPGTKTRR